MDPGSWAGMTPKGIAGNLKKLIPPATNRAHTNPMPT